MGKILVLGNSDHISWIDKREDVEYLQMPFFSLGEDGEMKMSQFVMDNFSEDISACALDVDNISNPELCLTFAMTLRLSIIDLKRAALIPILFVSNAIQDIFYGYKFSPIILTGSVAFEKPENASDAFDVMQPLSSSDFKKAFLDIIKIQPNATEGRHSLANQWGADVLQRIVIGKSTENPLIQKARRSLYFRYTQALTLKLDDIDLLAKGIDIIEASEKIETIDATGRKILLLDDEADKGWNDVLKHLFRGAIFTSISEKTPDYQNLSPFAKNEIENGNYDLIFLDLRMNGIDEDGILNPLEFSGMKILKEIKNQNKGTQVIMFTASNKAWNMKALLEEGADGYYIKESPEFAFSNDYSYSNALNLRDNIKKCLSVSSQLRSIWNSIIRIKSVMDSNNLANKYFRSMEVMHGLKYQTLISTELDIIWGLLQTNNAKRVQFAMISIFKILEFLNEFFYTMNSKNQLCLIDPAYKEIMFWDSGNWYKKGQVAPIYKNRKPVAQISKKDIESTTTKVHNIMKYVNIKDNDKTYSSIRMLGIERNNYIHAKNSATKSNTLSLNNIDIWLKALKNICVKL